MSSAQDRSGRRGMSYSDSGLNSGKSCISGSGSLTDSHVKSHWDSSRSNYKATTGSSEVLSTNNRELMKKYLADKNTTNTEVGIVPGLNKNGEWRSAYKPSVKIASMNNGDVMDFEDLNNSATHQFKAVALNGSGEGGHWPFSFNYKGLKTRRDDQNAYRLELDKQIEHKKLIREQETEQLKRISRQKKPTGLSQGKSSNSNTKLPWLAKSEEMPRNSSREMKPAPKNSNPELKVRTRTPPEPTFLLDNVNNANHQNPGAQLGDPNVHVAQSAYIQNNQNIPQQQGQMMNSPLQGVPGFVNFANLPPNQFQHPPPQIGLVKDMNTGILYQQIAQPYYFPTQQPLQMVNPQTQPSLAESNGPSEMTNKSNCSDDSSRNATDDKQEIKSSIDKILENDLGSKDAVENEREYNTLDTMNAFSQVNTGYKAGLDYKPHVSESSIQRPESAVLRTSQKLILDKQIEEKRLFEKQKKEREIEQEVLLQKKIKMYQEKMQLELQQEKQKQKELEEAKRISQEKAFQKQEQLRKETDERRKREKEERRKMLMALAEQEQEAEKTEEQMFPNENLSNETDEKAKSEMELEDERPLPAPLRFREVSTQSSESSSNESICICCTANNASRGDVSSAATLNSIPEIAECQIEVEVEPLLVDFTTALALESERMSTLLHSLETKQKIRQL